MKNLTRKCPICGAEIIDEENDFTQGEHCSNDECSWYSNQFMDYFDEMEINERVAQGKSILA